MAVAVVGAAHWDVIARAARPLAPGSDVPGRVVRRVGGVAANVAVALAAAGRAVRLYAAVGSDAAGTDLMAALEARGLETRGLVREGRSDGYVAIEAANGEMYASVADCRGLEAAGERLVASVLAEADGLAAVVADGNLGAGALARLSAARIPGALVLAAASPEKAGRLRPALAGGRARLYLNRVEAGALIGVAFDDAAAAARALVALGAAAAVVTDGPHAAASADRHATASLRPPAVVTRSVTGAGDALLAAHLDAILAGQPPEPALAAALAASARHIQGDAP